MIWQPTLSRWPRLEPGTELLDIAVVQTHETFQRTQQEILLG